MGLINSIKTLVSMHSSCKVMCPYNRLLMQFIDCIMGLFYYLGVITMDTKQKVEAVVIFFFMLVIGAFLLASNHSERPAELMTKGNMDIVETAKSVGRFNTLVSAIEAADLVETLKGQGPFTVFAPTDRAFAKLPEGTLEQLLMPENKERLAGILKHHVAKKNIMLRGRRFRSLNNTGLAINYLGEVTVNNARVVARNIPASNGIIHVIDSVLLPDDNEHRSVMPP